jgi:hypothetical protein
MLSHPFYSAWGSLSESFCVVFDTKGVINIEEGHAIQWPREKEEIDK